MEVVSFFAAGTFAFYALLAAVTVLLFIALDKNSWIAALGVTIVAAVTLTIWGDGIMVAKWLYHNPTYAAGGVIAYVVIGAVWGVGRWWVEVRKLARKCKEIYISARKSFLRSHKDTLGPDEIITDNTPVPASLRVKWKDNPPYQYRHFRLEFQDGTVIPPQASDYKPEILTWMAFWPISLIWTVLDDFVKELYENVYQYLAASLQRISDRAFADIIEAQKTDNTVEEEPKAPTNPDDSEDGAPLLSGSPAGNFDIPPEGGGIVRG